MKKRRERELNPPKREKAKGHSHRFLILGALFSILCVTFLVYLGITQINGAEYFFPRSDDIIRTETVYGERGRIFDRNGKLLVGNTESYNLIFEYGAMADKRIDVNKALIECIDTLRSTNTLSKRASDYFPLIGTYPNMSFNNDVGNSDSDIAYYYQKFLNKHNFKKELSAEDLCEYFVNKYKLWDDTYSSAAITELIRIYYDMERIDFGYYQHYTIAEGLDPSDPNEIALITSIKEKSIEGANFIKQTERTYPYDTYAAHILGRIGKISAENVDKYQDYPLNALVGISGCEAAFEEYLRGTDGKRISVYDKEGNLIKEYYDPAPVVGKDIYLTIDIELQIAAEDALREEIESLTYSEAGAATFMNPNNGEILVSASYPTYSQNQFSSVEYYASLASDENMPLLNRALQGAYAPGSVYKVGSALAALEQGLIDENTCYVCNKVYPDLGGPTCLGNHGSIDVTEAIEVSCNIFFYYVGHENGLDKITSYTKSLGLGSPTGVELGERVGVVATEEYCINTDKDWRTVDNATGAIGQSYHLYSPLQLSVYTSSLINGGTRYSAHLLDSVHKFYTGETVYTKQSEILDSISISPDVYNIIKNAMGLVVSENAEVYNAFKTVKVKVGGKTGTSQVTGKSDYAVFTGVAPLDSPEIVASCIIEQGKNGYKAAYPVGKIFEAYFN